MAVGLIRTIWKACWNRCLGPIPRASELGNLGSDNGHCEQFGRWESHCWSGGSHFENHCPRAYEHRPWNGIRMPVCTLTQPLSSCPQGQVIWTSLVSIPADIKWVVALFKCDSTKLWWLYEKNTCEVFCTVLSVHSQCLRLVVTVTITITQVCVVTFILWRLCFPH